MSPHIDSVDLDQEVCCFYSGQQLVIDGKNISYLVLRGRKKQL